VYTVNTIQRNTDITYLEHYVSGLWKFISLWDDAFLGNKVATNLQPNLSKNGNINVSGDINCMVGELILPHHSNFWSFIESGVRRAIEIFLSLDMITISSCEGHQNEKCDGLLYLRYINIIPRNELEFVQQKVLLQKTCSLTNKELPRQLVTKLGIEEWLVQTDDGPSMYSLGVVFFPLVIDEIQYFRDVEIAYDAFCENLSQHGNIQ
jgi:hypothetical protein